MLHPSLEDGFWCLPGSEEDDHDDERDNLHGDDDEDDVGDDDDGERDDLDEDCGRVELLNNRLDGLLLCLVFTIRQILTNLKVKCICLFGQIIVLN